MRSRKRCASSKVAATLTSSTTKPGTSRASKRRMTITTANRPRLVVPALPRVAPLAAAAALLASGACHADWKFTPTVGVAETYTDNVNLQSDALARSAFVTDLDG